MGSWSLLKFRTVSASALYLCLCQKKNCNHRSFGSNALSASIQMSAEYISRERTILCNHFAGHARISAMVFLLIVYAAGITFLIPTMGELSTVFAGLGPKVGRPWEIAIEGLEVQEEWQNGVLRCQIRAKGMHERELMFSMHLVDICLTLVLAYTFFLVPGKLGIHSLKSSPKLLSDHGVFHSED